MAGNLATSILEPADTSPAGGARGSRVALREPKRVWSFDTLADQAARASTVLAQLGVAPGESVALLLHDSMELAAGLLGAMRIGAVAVPVSILLRPHELRALLCDCAARCILVNADLAGTVDLIRAEVPTLRHILAIGGARSGQLDYQALVSAVDRVVPPVDVADEAPAFALYSASGGSRPRGVAHGRAALESSSDAYARGVLALLPDDRVFCAAKLSSAYGLGLGLLFPLRMGSSAFLLPARPRPRTLFDVMATFRPTVFAATPSLYAQMLHDYAALPAPRPAPFHSVRHAISGAEGLPAALGARIEQTFGRTPLHGFGVTEALHFVLSNRPGQARPASVGTPLAGVEARLVDAEGALVGPEEIGLLELRGPSVARAYLRDGEAELTPHDEPEAPSRILPGGWVRPGDRFLVDREGHYYHCGRQDDLFKVGGRWVSPDEIERTLLGHPAVWECAVVEGEDEDGLPRAHAFVVPNVGHPPSSTLSLTLMEYVKAEIAPYKYPREIEFVDSLPKSEAGRVQRWRLRPTASRPPRAAQSGE